MKTNDGTPDAVKVARPVWSGGKGGDNIKALPITISRGPVFTGLILLRVDGRTGPKEKLSDRFKAACGSGGKGAGETIQTGCAHEVFGKQPCTGGQPPCRKAV